MGALLHCILQDWSEKHISLMHLQLGEVPAVVVYSPEITEAIMKIPDVIFPSRPPILVIEIMMYGSKDLVFAPYGDF